MASSLILDGVAFVYSLILIFLDLEINRVKVSLVISYFFPVTTSLHLEY